MIYFKGRKFHQRLIQVVATIMAASGSIIILSPLLWMVSTSLKNENNVIAIPPSLIPRESVQVVIKNERYFIYDVMLEGKQRFLAAISIDPEQAKLVDPVDPDEVYIIPSDNIEKHRIINFHWENYISAWNFSSAPFGVFMRNTFLYSCFAMVAEVFICAFIGYGFARLRAPGRNILFVLVLGTIMIPPEIITIPAFMLFTRYIPNIISSLFRTRITFTDTWWPLILPKFFGEPFLIFLFRQFFLNLSKDYDDASRIDGCGYVQTWKLIILPMSKPAIIVAAIISFQYHWAQQYMEPLIYLNSTNKLPLTVGLALFESAYGGTPWNLMMAASLIALLPLILIFLALNRFFIQGIVVTGIKG